MKYMNMLKRNQASVKSFHPCKSVIQIMNDIVKAQGGVPIAIGIKVERKEARQDEPFGRGEGSQFIIQIPLS